MSMLRFLGLEATDDRFRWRLPVVPHLLTPGGFLFGGAALAAAVTALEEAFGRPLIWATAQYVSYASPPSVLDVRVEVAAAGRHVTQARVFLERDDVQVLVATAALGSRDFGAAGSWAERPDVIGPEDSPMREIPAMFRGSIMDHMEIRLAAGRSLERLDGRPGSGRCAYWTRLPEGADLGAAGLALLGDHVPSGIGQALGMQAGGNSLDNTIRVVRIVPTEWILLDIRIHAVQRGFAHGLVHLWAEDGTLLGTGSQSAIVRTFPAP
jgi:acyl-CoA thioesterase